MLDALLCLHYHCTVHNALAFRIRALRAQIGGAAGAGGGDAAARWCAACAAPAAAGSSAQHEARASASRVELAIATRCASPVRLRPHEGQRPPRQRHLLQV